MGGGGAGSLLPGASPAQHPPNMLQPMEEMILPPKRQAVVDRLRYLILNFNKLKMCFMCFWIIIIITDNYNIREDTDLVALLIMY